MAFSDSRAAVVEIIENRTEYVDEDTVGGGVIRPDEVRINGQSVLCSGEHPLKVHELVAGQDLVFVTLTLMARRVEIRADNPPEQAEPAAVELTPATEQRPVDYATAMRNVERNAAAAADSSNLDAAEMHTKLSMMWLEVARLADARERGMATA